MQTCRGRSMRFTTEQGIISDDREIKVLSLAGLLRRYHEGKADARLLEGALRSCEMLLEVAEQKETPKEIAALLGISEVLVRLYSEELMDLLIFNPEDDPFLSLGLVRQTTANEINRRWKRLIVLFHPDKYPGEKKYEERASRINWAHKKALEIISDPSFYTEVPDINSFLVTASVVPDFRPLRIIPTAIMAAAIVAAVLSLALFVARLFLG